MHEDEESFWFKAALTIVLIVALLAALAPLWLEDTSTKPGGINHANIRRQ